MARLSEIEALAKGYADAKDALARSVVELEERTKALTAGALPGLSAQAAHAAQEKALLLTAIEESPGCFERPRSVSFHGIKCGLRKRKGRLVVENQAATIQRIREQLGDRAELLIRKSESVVREALNRLEVSELRRIGVLIEADTDEVFVSSDADKIERFITALLEERQAEDRAVLKGKEAA